MAESSMPLLCGEAPPAVGGGGGAEAARLYFCDRDRGRWRRTAAAAVAQQRWSSSVMACGEGAAAVAAWWRRQARRNLCGHQTLPANMTAVLQTQQHPGQSASKLPGRRRFAARQMATPLWVRQPGPSPDTRPRVAATATAVAGASVAVRLPCPATPLRRRAVAIGRAVAAVWARKRRGWRRQHVLALGPPCSTTDARRQPTLAAD